MKPPLLDKRTRDDVLQQALTLAGRDAPPGWAGYVPDWTAPADPGDPAHRLLESFARLAELLIERLNQVPQTNFLSFLEFAGVERFPGAPAEVPVTFAVSKRAPLGGIVPAGTQVATTQTKNVDARVFETRRDFFASRATLESIVAVHPTANRFVMVPPPPPQVTGESLGAAPPIRVLTDTEAAARDVSHILYLASEELFGRKDSADITLTIDFTGGVFPSSILWQRFDKAADDWVTLREWSLSSSGPNQVRVTFPGLRDVAKTKVDGVEDFWLAARFNGTSEALATVPVVSSITGGVTPTTLSASLDAAFYNAAPIDTTKPFSPFGQRPAYGDALYLGGATAFSPANTSVTLTFTIRPYDTTVLANQFRWAPSMSVRTGAKWQILLANGTWADLATFEHRFDITPVTGSTTGEVTVTRFAVSATDGTFIGATNTDSTVQVALTLPTDVGLRELNHMQSRWIRVLLVSENPYGQDGVPGTGTTPRFVGPLFIPPRVESVSITFVPGAATPPITHIKTLNNFEFRDHPGFASAFPLFTSLSQRQIDGSVAFGSSPALYCGFDRQLEPDAFMSVFFDLAGPASTLSSPLESGTPVVAWEYWSAANGWRPLDAADETLNLTTSGTVAFVAPPDSAAAVLFAQIEPESDPDPIERWWMRARLASGRFDYPPVLRGIYINTAAAENRSTFSEVLIGSSNGEPDQTFALVKGPVLSGDVWVRETERPTAQEVQELDIEHASARGEPEAPETTPSPNVRDVPDASGEVWVRWLRVANFRLSGPRSRHYLLDAVAAIVRFGSGTRGHLPPVGRNNLVFRDLQAGGGAPANREVGALSVKAMKTSLPFIDKVFNVQPASAGASPWTTAEFEDFGPQALKNRGRAVTTEDYAWMVRQRFSDVARVRCRPVSEPGPGGTLQFKAGGVTALVVPWSTERRPQPSQGLIRKVREFLTGIVLRNITGDVHVKGPDYVAVDVAVTLVPTDPEFAMVVARKAQAALDAFLHPLTGGEDHEGYGFGRSVYLSEVHAVLGRIEEVDHVVSAHFVAAPGLDAFAITGDRLPSSGVHQITVLDAGS